MKFNTTTRNNQVILNHEGAKAYRMDSAMALYSAVVTWSLNDTFYEKNDERLIRIRHLIALNKPGFVAQLAIYARHEMHMRSVPLVLLTELARIHSGDNTVARATEKVITRADEITELLACYETLNKREGFKKLNRLSKQIQKGLAAAFNRFDEYQFAKYNRDTTIKLRDALFLVHPKAKNQQQQELFNKIAAHTLATPYTWETELSQLGQQKFETEKEKTIAFRQKWEELIDSNKLGYMALLRNLRNILQAGVSYAHLKKVTQTLSNGEQVARSKQFPFRFLSAYRELLNLKSSLNQNKNWMERLWNGRGYLEEVLDSLESAAQHSAKNFRGFDENTRVLLACDVSGSMQRPISPQSKILLYDIGLMLAMMLQSRCENVQVGMFGNTWKRISVPTRNILSNVQEFYKREGEVGYATNGHLVLKELLERKEKVDKIMFFTDLQLWNTGTGNEPMSRLWKQYKANVHAEARLYLFDLNGYGQVPLKMLDHEVCLIAGWSDKIFGVLAALEDYESVIETIRIYS
ncbi:TROVE domain-containing protein [Siphonobacter sp. SORGH_AS_1065]|uniref:TROVE domain-containing protein n=1 Tax=Siphonobacter sp. SORGH_AS_1065 TaxID=3041795 RepID=UPI002784CEF0|nr:TROVE domain-containing protein [Siphonobacter sp. SORGH_AS_1065]MDQ1089632.1 60 kDa SS-A/Ro ribonucleoprotein [Siphonobacter sp. SORGH_AS_1065]